MSVDVRRDCAEHRILAEMLHTRAFISTGVGPVSVFNLSYYEHAAAERLKSCGALVGAQTELGEATLALNLGAVSWSVMHGLRSPTQHIRLIPDELPPKPSKLQVVFKLQMEGWTPTAETPASWIPGQPMLCRADLVKRPLSYYLVLLRHEAVIAKGVLEISHQQCDGYYKCLLNVPSQQLPALLAAGQVQ